MSEPTNGDRKNVDTSRQARWQRQKDQREVKRAHGDAAHFFADMWQRIADNHLVQTMLSLKQIRMDAARAGI